MHDKDARLFYVNILSPVSFFFLFGSLSIDFCLNYFYVCVSVQDLKGCKGWANTTVEQKTGLQLFLLCKKIAFLLGC